LMLTTLGVAEINAELVETSRHKGRSHKVKSSWSQYGAAEGLKSFVQVDAKARYIGKVMADAKFEGIDQNDRDNHLHLKEILDKYDDVNDFQAMDSRQTMAVKMSMDDPFPYQSDTFNPPPSQIHRGEFTGFAEFMLTSFDNTFDTIGKLIEDLKAPPESAEFKVIADPTLSGGPDGNLISAEEWLKYYPRMIMIEADDEDADEDGERASKDEENCPILSDAKKARMAPRMSAEMELARAKEELADAQEAAALATAQVALTTAQEALETAQAAEELARGEWKPMGAYEDDGITDYANPLRRWQCADADGKLSLEEWKDMNVVGMDKKSFVECDDSRDGFVDAEEFQKCFDAYVATYPTIGPTNPAGSFFWLHQMALDEFNDADRNNDNSLTEDEFSEAESWTGGSSSSDKEKIQEEREIDCEEFRRARDSYQGVWAPDTGKMRANFDQINGKDDVIDREEWLTFSSYQTIKGAEAFAKIDKGVQDGLISQLEFISLIEDRLHPAAISISFSLADQDGNNKLDYAEVMALLMPDTSVNRKIISEQIWARAP